jgi:hypothetical protein
VALLRELLAQSNRIHTGKFIKCFSNSTAKHVPALNTLPQLQISLLK